ncbi:hypothetical protein LIER_01697 [Lithospermum erythrorhizon]|uniref:Protein kinase domain-containing protein n=1 Tax=Lithospermum erythrorhizon TaxID=34254 RepID=A0AAV3NMA7_LITER
MDCFFSFLLSIVLIIQAYPTSVDSNEKIPANNGPVITVRKHISFPDFKIDQEINLLGSAIISSEKNSIQIPDTTQEVDVRHLAGRAIFGSPIRLLDPPTKSPASFETTFSFQFQSLSNSTFSFPNGEDSNFTMSSPVDGGSGFSFIIVPDEFTVGRSGPWLGILNDACDEDYKSIAIEFDTRQNPEFGDPNDNHIGINLGSSIVSSRIINASDAGIDLNDGSVHRAWVSYDGNKGFIQIHLGSDKDRKLIYSGSLDLSSYLNEYMFIGFSASTGNHTQIHNIFSWNFTSTSQASLKIPSAETCESKILVDQKEAEEIKKHNKTPTSFLIFVAVVILVFVALLNFYFTRGRNNGNPKELIVLPEKKQRPRPPNKPRRFSLTEISNATRNFRELQILGSDTRSVTYKANMLNGCNVAVKRFLTQFFSSHGLDRKRVHKEIKAISKIRHPNLVPIRGWCFDRQESIVVYDYVPNGSLDKWLYGVGVLPWTRRFKVVESVAEALSYLHSKQLAHKNLKPSSVFLDVSFRAVLGDFGFVIPSAGSTRFESIVSLTADVFEFGVLALEVVAGRNRKSGPGGVDLLELAWSLHEKDEKVKLVDRRMGSLVIPEQAVRVIEVGLLCTMNENRGRPAMEEVLKFLNLETSIPELPFSRPLSLFPYSSTLGLCTGYSCASFK